MNRIQSTKKISSIHSLSSPPSYGYTLSEETQPHSLDSPDSNTNKSTLDKRALCNAVVLIVDDAPDTLGMLNLCLEQSGMSTLVALEGPQAIRIAQTLLPDIILLDAMMPGMNGFEVCRALKKMPALKSIPILFMTGLSDTDHVVEGFDAGGVDYITKPIKTTELIARMKVHLANAKFTQSAYNALDASGQSVICINALGEIQWATPHAEKTLHDLKQNNKNSDQNFIKALKLWLSHNPQTGMSFSMPLHQSQLRISLLRHHVPQNELLLKLDIINDDEEKSILREKFSITPKESDVLLWIARGKTNREIGLILQNSPRTINKHLEQIFKKLEVENRTAAALKALPYIKGGLA